MVIQDRNSVHKVEKPVSIGDRCFQFSKAVDYSEYNLHQMPFIRTVKNVIFDPMSTKLSRSVRIMPVYVYNFIRFGLEWFLSYIYLSLCMSLAVNGCPSHSAYPFS